MRYDALVARVAQRSQRRVVVGAMPPQLTSVVESLAGAGYVVTGVPSPSTFEAEVARLQPDLLLHEPRFPGHTMRRLTFVLEPGKLDGVVQRVDGLLCDEPLVGTGTGVLRGGPSVHRTSRKTTTK